MKIIILGGIFLSLVVPVLIFAAETSGVLYFSAPGVVAVGKNLTVVVMADPKGQLLDTVRAVVKFSKDTLEVKSVALSSAFSVADPDSFYSNTDGLVSYAGGIPGGTAQLAPFITITFNVKKAGNGSIAFDGQSIMLSGGVNMLSSTGQSLAINIAEPAATPQLVAQETAKPTATQNNSQPKPSAKTVLGSADTAALEIAAIPIVRQASFGASNYLIINKWFFGFWLLLAVNVVFIFRKKISVQAFKLVSKYRNINPNRHTIAPVPPKYELPEAK